jgi:hypothetical protein
MDAVCGDVMSCDGSVHWSSDRGRVNRLVLNWLIDLWCGLRDRCNLGILSWHDWRDIILGLLGRWACSVFLVAKETPEDRSSLASLLVMGLGALGAG